MLTTNLDYSTITKTLAILVSGVAELRIPKTQGQGTISGYFNDLEKMAEIATGLNGKVPAIYLTINPCIESLLSRAENKYKTHVINTTNDSEIVCRRWLLADLDAVRPAGISSSDAEHQKGIDCAYAVREYLELIGFPKASMVIGDSGNGAHLLIRIDLPNNTESTTLIQNCLKSLALRFDDDAVKVDQTTYNASRIIKLYGTWVAKGDNTAERPHRLAKLLDVPDTIVPAGRDLLENLASMVPKQETYAPSNGHRIDLREWLAKYNIEIRRGKPITGGTLFELKQCPWNPEHSRGEAYVIQYDSSALAAGCQHNSCRDKKWADLRKIYEPDYQAGEYAHQAKTDAPLCFNRTDTGNAEYFTNVNADRLRRDHRRNRWLEWQNHYWRQDNDGQVLRLAIKAIRDRFKNAPANYPDLKEREKETNWLIGCEYRSKLDNMIAIAGNLKPIADSGEQWDTDPWLFGVANGVIDLRTRQLRHGKPEDMMTMQSPVLYEETAKAERWLQFLNEIFDSNTEVLFWLQKYFGYCLTGITREQLWLIGYGRGANGKGRLQAILRHVFGDYAYNAPFATFEMKDRNPIPNDLAALVGKRFVTSSETNEGTRFNEARMKALAGEDPITARFLHCEFFTFLPVAKVFLVVNNRPRVNDDTYGFWRKVRLLPFNRQFKGQADDKELLNKLICESSGILNWLIEGCLKWQKEGFEPTPDYIMKATKEYEAESDPLAEFLNSDKLVVTDKALIQSVRFYKAYRSWCADCGMQEKEILTNNAFGRKMGQKFKKVHQRDGTYYLGVGMDCDGFVTDSVSNYTKTNINSPLSLSHALNIEKPSQSVTPSQNIPPDDLSPIPDHPCPKCNKESWGYDGELRVYCTECGEYE